MGFVGGGSGTHRRNRRAALPQAENSSNGAHGKEKGGGVSLRKFFSILKDARPSYVSLAIAGLLSFATTGSMLIIPLVLRSVVNGFSGGTAGAAGSGFNPFSMLSTMGAGGLSFSRIAILAAALLAQTALGGLAAYLLNRAGQGVVARLRDRIWKKLLRLRVPYYDERASGDVISRVTNDTAVLRTLITENISGFFTGIVSVVGAVSLMLVLDWRMTLTMLAALPIAAAAMLPLGRIMRSVSVAMQNETANLTAVLSQTVSEIRLVKASTAEAQEYRSGAGIIDRLFRVGLKEGRVQAFVSPLMSLVLMALLVLVIGYGGLRVSSGALSAGDLVAFILYLVQIIMPMGQIVMFATQLQKARGATESIATILEEPEEILPAVSEVSPPVDSLADSLSSEQQGAGSDESITFDHLSFSYDGTTPVIHDASFAVERGQVTALVGPSGAGKTTLFSLIERFYQPQEGTLLVGGVPLESIPLVEWRSRIGYVSQESPAVAGTIRENITYGLGREATDEEIVEAAKSAYADEFVRELPAGYDTEIGERGVKLSGGQRQRIAIARALLRDPAVLMLDEATSSLDSESEQWVQRALENLMKGRTTVVIAHRLSTVMDADKIVFLERGRVTGEGTHEELLAGHRTYRSYAEHQLRVRSREETVVGEKE